MLAHLLILWGLVALALVLALVVERWRRRAKVQHEVEDGESKDGEKKDKDKPEYSVALGFVASSYGVLVGLLIAFAVNHHADVRLQAQTEAGQFIALWDTVAVYPPKVRDPARHDIICYMRAIRDDDWPSMARGIDEQSPRALAFGDHLRATINQLPTEGARAGSAYGRAQSTITTADTSRQQLLFFSQPRVPAVLWAVIYVGAFLLFLLIAMHYAARPAGRVVSLGAVVFLLTVVVATLTALDQPYTGVAKVGPAALTHAIDLLRPGNAQTAVFGPCVTPPSTRLARLGARAV